MSSPLPVPASDDVDMNGTPLRKSLLPRGAIACDAHPTPPGRSLATWNSGKASIGRPRRRAGTPQMEVQDFHYLVEI